tara:strand:- start:465 stop:1082 length:618 start_codon:yes stop_codon:yes gene_type:complete
MKSNAWRSFKTFGKLVAEVQSRVNVQQMNTPFEDELLSDLISERHYVCGPQGLRPRRFKKTSEDNPYRFYGDFEGIGWHPVSWRDAASKTSRKKKEALSKALRLEIVSQKISYRKQHELCERCGLVPPDDVHHEEPTWKNIVVEVMRTAGDEAIAKEMAHWDWFKLEEFRVRPEGRVKEVFDEIHRSARLEALCKTCHNKAELQR